MSIICVFDPSKNNLYNFLVIKVFSFLMRKSFSYFCFSYLPMSCMSHSQCRYSNYKFYHHFQNTMIRTGVKLMAPASESRALTLMSRTPITNTLFFFQVSKYAVSRRYRVPTDQLTKMSDNT